MSASLQADSARALVLRHTLRGLGVVLIAVLVLSMGANRARAQSAATAVLTLPGAGQTIVGEAEIRGTVGGPGFSRYDLHYRPVGTEREFIYFGGGGRPVASGVLGVWSGLNLTPGDYEIRLTAHFTNRPVIETSVRFALADRAHVGELASASGAGPGSRAGPDSELRDALDRLTLRVRPASLWGYLERGARLSAAIGGLVLVYFVLKALLVWLLRRGRSPR